MPSSRTALSLLLASATLCAGCLSFAPSADARITRIVIDTVESPTFEGRSFGATGQYEKLVGRAFGEVDPRGFHNAIITDIDLAPRNERGMVEYETTFFLLKPIDLRLGNRNIFHNVVNRGNKGGLSTFNRAPGTNNPTTAADAGDGLLMRQGYAILWSGWQPDVLPGNDRMTMQVPVARRPSGAEITAELRTEYIVSAVGMSTLPLGGGQFTNTNHASYETVSLDNSAATLTRRIREGDPRVEVSRERWAFADCTSVAFPGTPSATQICLQDNFDPNFIYELVYTAKNPGVFGLGFAATRDLIAFFKHELNDDDGTPNPLAFEPQRTGIRRAITMGSSQSGRYIRTLLHLGFNEDERGRIVFEGAFPHISPGRIPLNVRFAQPGRGYGQHEDNLFPSYESPFTYQTVRDPLAGRSDGILRRCRQSGTCPRIVHAISSLEYWQGRQSLNQTDALGGVDLDLPSNVRMFLMSSTQHGPAAAPPPGHLPPTGICRWPANSAPQSETMRALWVALDAWVNQGRTPPDSQIPRLADGTLVPPDPTTFGFPVIPRTTYFPEETAPVDFDGIHNALAVLDFGPDFIPRDESGRITLNPPMIVGGTNYAVLVPAVDVDGNDVAGVRSTAIQAPLGTATGWSRRREGFAADEQCGLTGLYIPFPTTEEQRVGADDPRLSLEERYGDHAGYVAAVAAAADALTKQRLLLAEDAQRLIEEAENSDVLR